MICALTESVAAHSAPYGVEHSSTYICIVIPMARRSLTRSTLLITSRPRSSNTRTFQMGSPSAVRMGAVEAKVPFA